MFWWCIIVGICSAKVLAADAKPRETSIPISVPITPPTMTVYDSSDPVLSIVDVRNYKVLPVFTCCGVAECYEGKNPFDGTSLEKGVICRGLCTGICCQGCCGYCGVLGQSCFLLDERNFKCGPLNMVANCRTETETYCCCCLYLCNWFDPYKVSCLQETGRAFDACAHCRDGLPPTSCYFGCCLRDRDLRYSCNYMCLDCGDWSTEIGGTGRVGLCGLCGQTKKVQDGREFSHCCWKYACLKTYCLFWLCSKLLCRLSL